MSLAREKCIPVPKGTPPLAADEVARLLAELGGGWKLSAAGHLERDFRFADFARALAFANEVGAIAERENHHPEMTVGWGRCRLDIWTDDISGLSRNDFILAAKASEVASRN